MTTNVNIPASLTAGMTTQASSLSDVPPIASSNLTAIGPATSTGTSIPPPTTTPGNEGGGHQNRAWLAGPVVGSLAGTAVIVAAVIFFLLRRRRKARNPQDGGNDAAADKPQLHSDCLPKPLPHELANSEKRVPVELPETSAADGSHHELPDQRNPVELEAPTTTTQAPSRHETTTCDRQDS